MHASLALLLAIVAAVTAQRNNVDPRNAAILAEARYLQGDGSFGSAYVQEDGVEFKEETVANGERKGQYSYVDPDGKKITVQYTAGKNGFQVSGDHLPRAPIPSPAHQQAPAPRAPQYNPAAQYNSIQQQQPQQQYNNQQYQGGNAEDGQYRPEIHEHPYQYKDGGNHQQYNNNNNYNNAPVQRAPQQQQQQNYNSGFNYQAPQYNNYQQQTTTQAPNRFFPPGKLDLNRTPDGYQYQFSSNGRQ